MKKVQNGDTVTVHYTGRLEDGSVFDTSRQEGRTPITEKIGDGKLIKGFENGILEMIEGESKTIEIEHTEAYGPINELLITEIPKNQVPENAQVGEMLQGMGPQGPIMVKITEVKEDTVVIDANHPLAGKKLIFDLEIMSIS
jgi:FKBP-type peptidyl-prolyl cis-trans isomerase 2